MISKTKIRDKRYIIKTFRYILNFNQNIYGFFYMDEAGVVHQFDDDSACLSYSERKKNSIDKLISK